MAKAEHDVSNVEKIHTKRDPQSVLALLLDLCLQG